MKKKNLHNNRSKLVLNIPSETVSQNFLGTFFLSLSLYGPKREMKSEEGGVNRQLLWPLIVLEFTLPILMQHCSRAFVLPELLADEALPARAVTSFTPSRGNGPKSDALITGVCT